MRSDRTAEFTGALVMMLLLSPLVYFLTGLAVWTVGFTATVEPYLSIVLIGFMVSPLMVGLVAAGVNFRNGNNPGAAGWALGAFVATAAACTGIWYVLRNVRIGF